MPYRPKDPHRGLVFGSSSAECDIVIRDGDKSGTLSAFAYSAFAYLDGLIIARRYLKPENVIVQTRSPMHIKLVCFDDASAEMQTSPAPRDTWPREGDDATVLPGSDYEMADTASIILPEPPDNSGRRKRTRDNSTAMSRPSVRFRPTVDSGIDSRLMGYGVDRVAAKGSLQ
ncbi:hypothetical protein CDD80_4272 [Ophiocordyceps camponoti-rufipedis]|uniref:Protein kinase domain-containing protein n=1 Tax=Ophiocordyceps camponoti-rufipedis TaxID=2004952 RepID=A0A2C5YTC7_9HYPO|nr:hypothetical protein CDD80_4272 [Ophiocordyceps camponoti-rufipedis]